jgi:hypothetical protein
MADLEELPDGLDVASLRIEVAHAQDVEIDRARGKVVAVSIEP